MHYNVDNNKVYFYFLLSTLFYTLGYEYITVFHYDIQLNIISSENDVPCDILQIAS